MEKYNVFRIGSDVILGVVDGHGNVVGESVRGFGFLVDQIRRGVVSEGNLLVVKREVLESGALRNDRSLGTTFAALFKQREPGLVSGRVYRPIRVYHKVGQELRRRIREYRGAGYSLRQLAERFGIGKGSVQRALAEDQNSILDAVS